MAKRSKSSSRWLQRQQKDYFARRAKSEGQVSRAHYKLQQIDEKYRLIRPRDRILELGAAPGGWTRYLEERADRGVLVAVDPLPITTGAQTVVVEGALGDEAVDAQIAEIAARAAFDLVLSDMAPNMSGVRAVDQARSMDLADMVLEACEKWLRPGGHMALKAFQGEGLDDWVVELRSKFNKIQMTKPKASRPDSREVFVVARAWQRGPVSAAPSDG
ncbi:MAG: RlmE family RNA methyltransferase [Pseudomonadota bacterium]